MSIRPPFCAGWQRVIICFEIIMAAHLASMLDGRRSTRSRRLPSSLN
ncbi:hypothetical protein [Pseudomonas sp. BIGb0408]|nr:hypothetical protein [Pseudomonas sp. BIGb0408]